MTQSRHELSLLKLGGEIWQRRKWLLITTFIILLAAGVALIRALPPLYSASTTIVVGQSDILETMVVNGDGNEIEQQLTMARQELLSRSRLEQLIVDYNLYPEMRQTASRQVVLERMRSDIAIEQGMVANFQRPAYPITIRYRSWDPELAAEVANALADRFTRMNQNIRKDQVAGTATFLRERLDEVQNRLQERENALNEFKISHLGELPEQQNINLATLERLNAELRLNGEKQIQLLDRLNTLAGFSSGDGMSAGSGLTRLEYLNQQLVQLRSRYTSQHPQVIRIEEEIKNLEKIAAEQEPITASIEDTEPATPLSRQRVFNGTEGDLNSLAAQEANLRERITELQERLESVPRIDQELQQLTRDYETVREEYADIQSRYRSASMMESVNESQERQFTVLEEALPPEFPNAPGRMGLMIMSFIMAGACAGGLVCMREQFDTTFHSIRDLHSYAAVPVLGSVTIISTSSDTWRKSIGIVLKALAFVIALIAIIWFFDFAGERLGRQLVWLLAGRMG